MATRTDIVNLALQTIGSRTTVTDAELANNSSNEAIQANLTYTNTRDSLLRMAPWDCATAVINLTYITSVPGTPENASPSTSLWQPGQPAPPWTYEYQYPNDCLRALWIIPAIQNGFANNSYFSEAIKYRVQTDLFYPVLTATVVGGGSGYAVGDSIVLASGDSTVAPIGAPAVLTVLTAPGGVVGTVAVVNQIMGSTVASGGSYFAPQTNPVAQGSTTGSGTDATFNLTFGPQSSQRVILVNQQSATLSYIRQVVDPNVWDPLFQDAMANKLGADIVMGLTGDKQLANYCLQLTNESIQEARALDGNESLTINDHTPDWIRIRGVHYEDIPTQSSFNWGGLLPTY